MLPWYRILYNVSVIKTVEDLYVISMDGGQWTPASRARYNLRDTVARCTTQVCTKQPFGFVIFFIRFKHVQCESCRCFCSFC